MALSFSFNPFTGNFDTISTVALATVGSSPNSAGASISATQILTLEPADGSNPGLITAGAQAIGGIKTFNATIYAPAGMDVAGTGGTDTLSIGGINADVINIGRAGATINLIGTTIHEQVTDLLVDDPLITINVGGAVGSGANSGIQIEEASSITGYAETSADRNSWILKAPNTAGIATITPGVAGITLAGNVSGTNTGDVTIGTANGLSLIGQALSLGLSSTSTIGALSNTDWNTFNSKQNTITVGALDAQAENANGLALVSNVLSGQSADATHPGMVNITTQTFAGNKTFSGTIGASNLSGTNTGDITLTVVDASPNANGASLSGQALTLQPANTSFPGVLLAADWNTFNNKQPAGSYITALTSDVSASGPGSAVATVNSVGGSSAANVNTATTLVNGAQSGNKVLASPSGGGSGAPAFRALVSADIPNLDAAKITTGTLATARGGTNSDSSAATGIAHVAAGSWTYSAVNLANSDVTGVVPLLNGGTGTAAASANAAFNALSPMTNTGDIIFGSISGAATRLGVGSAGNVLTVAAAGLPQWITPFSTAYDKQNLGLQCSVAASALTIALKRADGSTNPAAFPNNVSISFRSATATSGAYAKNSTTGALSVVVPSGATLGGASGVTSYIWVYAIDNAGTTELAVSGSGIFADYTIQSTTAITSGATSASVLYSTSARTNVGIRLIAVLTVNEVTAGTWATAPSVVNVNPIDPTNLASADTGGVFGTLPATSGGTAQATYTTGDILYASATNTLSKLPIGSSTNVLTVTGGVPVWAAPAAGFTNPMTTQGDIITGGASGTPGRLALGGAGKALSVLGSQTSPSYNTLFQTPSPNYISANPDAEVDTTGWATYADAAQNIPVDATGGSATGLTFSRSTSTPLHGSGSFSMVQANSTSLQGKGVSYDFTLDAGDQAKPLQISFDYNASSTFVSSDGITPPLNDGTSSTNAGNSDIEVFLYDITNAVLIPVSPQVITANGANNFSFKGTFQTASNSTSYRLVFHIATASANATGWTFKFDNVYVGKQISVYGAVIEDWTTSRSFTPSSAAFGTISAPSYYTRRVGDTLEFKIYFTTGTVAANTAKIAMPAGLVIDSTKMAATNTLLDGLHINPFTTDGVFNSASLQTGVTFYDGSDTANIYLAIKTGTAGAVQKDNASVWMTNSRYTVVTGRVPIAGWSSSAVMSNDTDTRVVECRVNGQPANMTTPAAIIYPSVLQDTHGAYNATTGIYTIPVSGWYQVTATGLATVTAGSGMFIYKNSTKDSLIGMNPLANNYMFGSGQVKCVAGDTIFVTSESSMTSFTATATTNNLAITRISGPATIAANETVAASYFISTNQSYTANTQFNYDTKIFDTHSAVTSGASWKFTAPISGIYLLNGVVNTTATAIFITNIYKNGSKFKTFAAGSNINADDFQGGGLIRLLAGDFIDIRGQVNATLSGSATNVDGGMFLDINRIGN